MRIEDTRFVKVEAWDATDGRRLSVDHRAVDATCADAAASRGIRHLVVLDAITVTRRAFRAGSSDQTRALCGCADVMERREQTRLVVAPSGKCSPRGMTSDPCGSATSFAYGDARSGAPA